MTQKLLGHTMTVGILTASFNLLVIFVPLYISEMTEVRHHEDEAQRRAGNTTITRVTILESSYTSDED